MRIKNLGTFFMAVGFGLAGAGAGILAQNQITPGHDRVPPHREPSPYLSAACCL